MRLINNCKQLIKKEKNIFAIIFFGSRARGDFKKNSDYDLMFITKSIIKSLTKEHKIKQEYKNHIAKKTSIDKNALQISLWPLKSFTIEYLKGNSFIHCALRDGQIIISKDNRTKFDALLKKTVNCKGAITDRIDISKKGIEVIETISKKFKQRIPNSLDYEELGFSAMHLCWAVCMLNNFYPTSKYTILNECEDYFTKKEFKSIKEAYNLYSTRNQNCKNLKKKKFLELLSDLKKILKKTERNFLKSQ